ncbi:hypothetical protein [Rhodococcus pyridinivorans]|uniref:Uncharacterized protein n=1 Tax=Rhodococcus pyridinivorans TaxID=103816 RepID=A0A7M2XHQ0_9NOCA|nr:hypothetical protein [Rhodococcus pyridinivorans]QOV97227.1 hypothetical protein INP59_14755 [Rhodococcus pyridinivorans]
MSKLAELTRQAVALRKERDAELRAFARDPQASDIENAYLEEKHQKAVEERYTQRLAELRDDAERTTAEAKTKAERHMTFDTTDAAALIRSEQAWTHIVRPALEKGRTLDQALAGADEDAVFGAHRFAAAFIGDSAPVSRAVTARLSELRPDVAEEIRAGVDADAQLSAFEQTLSTASRGDTLEAAIGMQYAFGPSDETEADESDNTPTQGESLATALGARYHAV